MVRMARKTPESTAGRFIAFSRPSVARSFDCPQFGGGDRRRVLVGETAELAQEVVHLLADELGLGLRRPDAGRPGTVSSGDLEERAAAPDAGSGPRRG